MSVNSTRNPEMVEGLSADFRRLYNPTHAMGDAIDMMKSLPVCRAIYPGSANGGRVSSGSSISDAPIDGYMYVRRNAAWVSGGFNFQNNIIVGDGTSFKSISINGATSNVRDVIYSSTGSPRWVVRCDNTAESGSNAGSDFQFVSRTDAGAFLATPLFIRRSNGRVGMGSTNPSARLHLSTSDTTLPTAIIENTNAAGSASLSLRSQTYSVGGLDLFHQVTTNDAYIINRENADMYLRTNNTNYILLTNVGNVSMGHAATPLARLDIRVTSATFLAPVIRLEQVDLSEEFINFVSSVGAGNPVDTAAIGTYYGKARVSVNGTFKYVALYNS